MPQETYPVQPTDDTVPRPPRQGGPDDPAFPLVVPEGADCDGAGLSIREWYAGQALARLAGQFPDQLGVGGTAALTGAERCAAACLAHADALIAAMEKFPPAAGPGAG
jgi:hypothetical protein